MTSESTAADMLKYAAAMLQTRTDWALDSIAGAICDQGAHEDELDDLHDTVNKICALAAGFGDPGRYSDGRLVQSSKEIVDGLVTGHLWHPDPASETPRSWRANLPSDPGVPSPGIYEVTTDPATQQIHVRVIRVA